MTADDSAGPEGMISDADQAFRTGGIATLKRSIGSEVQVVSVGWCSIQARNIVWVQMRQLSVRVTVSNVNKIYPTSRYGPVKYWCSRWDIRR